MALLLNIVNVIDNTLTKERYMKPKLSVVTSSTEAFRDAAPFALLDEPVSFQLSMRIANMISCYGSEAIHKALEDALMSSWQDDVFDYNGMTFTPMTNEEHGIFLQMTQTVRYFGPDDVKLYWNSVFTRKVG